MASTCCPCAFFIRLSKFLFFLCVYETIRWIRLISCSISVPALAVIALTNVCFETCIHTYIIFTDRTPTKLIQQEEFPTHYSSSTKPRKLGFILASLPHPVATNVIKTPWRTDLVLWLSCSCLPFDSWQRIRSLTSSKIISLFSHCCWRFRA